MTCLSSAVVEALTSLAWPIVLVEPRDDPETNPSRSPVGIPSSLPKAGNPGSELRLEENSIRLGGNPLAMSNAVG